MVMKGRFWVCGEAQREQAMQAVADVAEEGMMASSDAAEQARKWQAGAVWSLPVGAAACVAGAGTAGLIAGAVACVAAIAAMVAKNMKADAGMDRWEEAQGVVGQLAAVESYPKRLGVADKALGRALEKLGMRKRDQAEENSLAASAKSGPK